MEQSKIRNFCIISHIDHGKSTLADRFLEITKTVEKRKMREQYLDQMDLEREKGITIKLQPVRMELEIPSTEHQIPNKFQYQNSNDQNHKNLEFGIWNLEFSNSRFILNLIDTPGHVDFTYEVSRSLACVEGALLLVDATQGIEAQTIANLYLAREQGLVIIPVINKIDLPNARVDQVEQELMDLLKCNKDDVLRVSAKTGQGVEELLQKIVEKIPAPITSSPFFLTESKEGLLQALIFDSYFDEYKGVIAYVRIFNGEVKTDDLIYLIGTKKESEVLELGYLKPELKEAEKLQAGEIGYIITGLKDLASCRVGDTIIHSKLTFVPSSGRRKTQNSKLKLPGYKEVRPMVFAGLYVKEGKSFQKLKEALEKLKLNDAALSFEPESSLGLGYGFRAGFLGLLHLDIIKERLKREYGLDIILTVPSVAYRIKLKTKNQKPKTHMKNEKFPPEAGSPSAKKINEIIIHSPQELPDPNQIERIEEPWVKADIITPTKYLGRIMKLVDEKQGQYKNTEYMSQEQVIFHSEIPLTSILVDFYDKIKSVSSGYASLNWEFLGFRPCEVQKLDILVAGEKVEPLSTIVYQKNAYQKARFIVDRLKKVLPKQLFEVKIQAAIGSKIIASSKIPALRKDVTAKLYGGDVTRKMKLLERQKKGKKKMKALGKLDIPDEAYLALLKR